MGRPRQHDASTGVRLLDVAEELLASGGEDAVTVRSVAEAAGTSTRAVYAVFGSKEALIAALATRGYGILEDLVDELPVTQDPVADLVAAGTSCFRTFATTRPHLFRLTFERVSASMLENPTAGPALMSSYRALLRRITAARIAAGHAIPDDTVAFGFHSLCVGLANSELARRPPPDGAGFWGPVRGIDGEELWRTALGAFVRGLR
jgi:AcrR family transcriptional regulator